jgi:RNA polymerase sigma-70 factor, ECF subfamily
VLLATVMTLGVVERREALLEDRHRGDVALARRVASGEVAALGELYDAHHQPVRAFCQRLFAGGAEAEDLVQETFLAAPSALRRFEGRSSLRTFLVSIAVNHARHHRRAVARRVGMLERLHLEPLPEPTRPDEANERAELVETMASVLLALPLDQRVAVVLCIVEERTSAEAAQIVGVAEATIRTRIFHARKKMKQLLASQLVGELDGTPLEARS